MIEIRDQNTVTRYDLDHYIKVRSRRRELGYIVDRENKVHENHPLVGKRVYSNETGKTYTIEQVYDQHFMGWYRALLLVQNGSHGIRIYQNISCVDPIIINAVKETEMELIFL